MNRQIAILRVFYGLLLLGPVASEAIEPVVVFSKRISTSETAEQENLEIVLRSLPAQRLKWAAFEKRTLTYVVRQKSIGLLLPDACEGLPIRVTIVSGRLQSAVYARSGGQCKNGRAAGRNAPSGERLYLTPDEIFERVAQADKQLHCYKSPGECLPTSLYVTYDDKLGLPIKLENYSASVSDYYWSLQVRDIKLKP